MSDQLARILLANPEAPTPPQGAYLLTWNPNTYENTVSLGGAVNYTNVAVINPSLLSIGPVLIIHTPGGPVVLGRIHKAP